MGTMSHARNRKDCDPWSRHGYTRFIDGSRENASNYCRNPKNNRGVDYQALWCYTGLATGGNISWLRCEVNSCGEYKLIPVILIA